MNKRETATLADTELRVATGADGVRTISGLIPYNSLSVDLGGFQELIAPGAFSDALQPSSDVLALRDHDAKILLGRTKAGTLKLIDSDQGLRYTITLPNTTQANDLAESVSRGDLDSTSFGFAVVEDDWAVSDDTVLRTLKAVELLEVSPCSFPAYPDSAVSIRTAPKDIRAKLKPTADPDDLSDSDDDEERSCPCNCAQCLDDDCEHCSNIACDSDECECDNGSDDDDEDRSRHMALELRKRRQ